MHYQPSTDCGVDGRASLLRERRGGPGGPRDHYRQADDYSGMHPVTEAAERRVRRAGEGRERFRRILALSEYLARSPLPETARSIWLELEEALHGHWLDVAIEHYNLGVDAGLARAAIDAQAPADLPARDRARALVDALRRTVDEL